MSKPEKVFKMGAVRASIFCNTIERDGQVIPIRKVVIEVRYRDKAGQWQGTNSLSLNEVPKAVAALQQAYEYLLTAGNGAGNQGASVPGEADGAEDPISGETEPISSSEKPAYRPVSGYPRVLGSKHY